jgi:hypothetical protein
MHRKNVMKSTGSSSSSSNIGFEEDVELLSLTVVTLECSPLSIDRPATTNEARQGFVATAEMVLEASTENQLDSMFLTKPTFTGASAPLLYRSKCHPDDIPVVARNLTWEDPLYEESDSTNEIIAAFDIDRTLYDRSTLKLFQWFILMPIASFVPLFIAWQIVFEEAVTFFIILAIYISIVTLSLFWWTASKYRIERMHLAVGARGIHIDEVDVPDSNNLMCHTLIKFEDIEKCSVESEFNYFIGKIYYRVKVCRKNDDFTIVQGEKVFHSFTLPITTEGIRKQQKFVDVVNAMIERCNPDAAATTFPSIASTLLESDDTFPVTNGFVESKESRTGVEFLNST